MTAQNRVAVSRDLVVIRNLILPSRISREGIYLT